MTVLLLYGRDQDLLQSRRWLLEKQGYCVFAITDPRGLQQINEPVDLLIVCHSVSAPDCLAFSALAKSRWPGIRELILLARTSDTPCTLGAQVFSTLEGPAKLLSTVKMIVHSNPSHAAQAP